jgi:hypothetical protein
MQGRQVSSIVFVVGVAVLAAIRGDSIREGGSFIIYIAY